MKDQTTIEAAKIHDPAAEREHGPTNDLEHYYNPDSTERICITTDEREEFELDSGMDLGADVLSQIEWDALLGYCRDNSLLPQAASSNPRFVWIVGAIHETYSDLAGIADQHAGTVLWDRQEKKPVVTIAPEYGQAFCLETTTGPESQPFTTLESWLNGLAAGNLSSEGIADTQPPFA